MAYGHLHTSKPKACPRCRAPKIVAVPETISGLKPWRCAGCGVIGWGDRIVGDPMPFKVEPSKPRERKRLERYGAQRPKRYRA